MATRKAAPSARKKVVAAKSKDDAAPTAAGKKKAKAKTAPAKPKKAKSAVPTASMIADAAYYRAEQRGFAPGNELDDWLAAEAEVVEQISRALPGKARARPAGEA